MGVGILGWAFGELCGKVVGNFGWEEGWGWIGQELGSKIGRVTVCKLIVKGFAASCPLFILPLENTLRLQEFIEILFWIYVFTMISTLLGKLCNLDVLEWFFLKRHNRYTDLGPNIKSQK